MDRLVQGDVDEVLHPILFLINAFLKDEVHNEKPDLRKKAREAWSALGDDEKSKLRQKLREMLVHQWGEVYADYFCSADLFLGADERLTEVIDACRGGDTP